MTMQTYRPSGSAHRAAPPASFGLGRRFVRGVRSLGGRLRRTWAHSAPVPPEQWTKQRLGRLHRLRLTGYVEGLSVVFKRCRWDAGFRWGVMTAGLLLLMACPIPVNICALAGFLWLVMPT
jgi:hypothetical protein